MKTVAGDPQLFAENRQRLLPRLLPHSLAVLHSNDVQPTNADGQMGFHQNSDLFYLTGINQEETILLLAPDAVDESRREILFIRRTSPLLAVWEGAKLTQAQAAAVSGVKNVRWLDEFPGIFHPLMCEMEHVYLNANEHPRAVIEVESRDARFIRQCQERWPLHTYHRLARILYDLRMVKSEREIDAIRRACSITASGFERALQFVRPGVNEAEVEAEFAHEFIRNKAAFAYSPIIAAGPANCVLHYTANDQPCRKGDLLLLDVAAGYGNYMSDLTRTIPISGKFTRRQKQVYRAVLRIFRQTLEAMRPGVRPADLRKQVEQWTTRECVDLGLLTASEVRKQDPNQPAVRKYFMHGVSHGIGLDVHDVGVAGRPMEAGWVVTCEPAIYIPQEKFGIRLENTVVVRADGVEDLMADIPIEPDDIEGAMA